MGYELDRFLLYDELRDHLADVAARYPHLVTVESYGTSHEGRDLVLVTVTDASTGPAGDKPAHWVDANIHATEWTGGVAALALLDRLVTAHGTEPAITEALRTRTFYIAPRVNPDGVERTLTTPGYLRSSTRLWPWLRDPLSPGVVEEDLDGDGVIRTVRVPDDHGPYRASVADPRVMVVVGPAEASTSTQRYRLYTEGRLRDVDGFTAPPASSPTQLDLNRNFPAGWATSVPGRGDHPLSEPEIDALVRAIVARPNVCGYNAFHTAAGAYLRPSSTRPDAELPPVDLHVWKQFGATATAMTGYPAASVFEDYTWDKSELMAGAADDWAYEHLGVYSWTTEFWDVIFHATGSHATSDFWTFGPTEAQQVAVARWCADQGLNDALADWTPFDHPDLGPVEIGGWDFLNVWTNAPRHLLQAEVTPHADVAVHQALAAPEVRITHQRATAVGPGTFRVEIGVANVGYLPTTVTAHAAKNKLVLPLVVTLEGECQPLDGPLRREVGQLPGRLSATFEENWRGDRALVGWLVRAEPGTPLRAVAQHQRAGRHEVTLTLP